MSYNQDVNAVVISVTPSKIKVSVDKIEDFKIAEEKLKVGSYLRVSDNDDVALLAVIENFSIVADENGGEPKYHIDASPIGLVKDNKFYRGGDSLALPPKQVEPASIEDIKAIYESSVAENEKFIFSSLSLNEKIAVPVNGNRFFNKHIAIVGSSGSGKSHTVAKIIQKAVLQKNSNYDGLNNSHIAIFDIHSEYSSAFPSANLLGVEKLVLPYWLLNSEELEELFLDTDANDHNQRNVFREAIILNKKFKFTGDKSERERIHYDSPSYFDMHEVLCFLKNRNNEKKDKDNIIKWFDTEEFNYSEETASRLFKEELTPLGSSASGTLNGKLINFINRLENKLYDKRLDFLLGERTKAVTFENSLKSILGYTEESSSNITIFDVSGIPFEVLSICVSLISRLIFDIGYYNKKFRKVKNQEQDVPILVVYEEAHKYAPRSGLSKYRASKEAIERIAKEGRKYGVTLLLASQRPSEISETIFSQCSSFISMRLTNKEDQSFVKRLLPDTVGDITNILPALTEGEALLIGDSVSVPSLVKIERCDTPPSSSDIKYLDEWQEKWKELAFESLVKSWGV